MAVGQRTRLVGRTDLAGYHMWNGSYGEWAPALIAASSRWTWLVCISSGCPSTGSGWSECIGASSGVAG
jgi:hypothetical protein